MDLLSRGLQPVISVGDSNICMAIDHGRNQHSFIAREDGLAPGTPLTSGVLYADICRASHAIRLVGERLRDFAVFVTVQSTILIMFSVGLKSTCRNLPLKDKMSRQGSTEPSFDPVGKHTGSTFPACTADRAT